MDDPSASSGERGVGDQSGVDTTPTLPEPPIELIEAAGNDIPTILANIKPQHDGTIVMEAKSLVKRLVDKGNTRAAAYWAMDTMVRDGRLEASPVISH